MMRSCRYSATLHYFQLAGQIGKKFHLIFNLIMNYNAHSLLEMHPQYSSRKKLTFVLDVLVL